MEIVNVLFLMARKKENPFLKNDIVLRQITGHNYITYEDNNNMDVSILKSKALHISYKYLNEKIKWRLYISVDARDVKKAKITLVKKMIDEIHEDNEKFNISAIWKSILMQQGNRLTRNFLLDVDTTDKNKIQFLWDKIKEHDINILHFKSTPNGKHIITQGFNPNLIKDFDFVEIKKNALFFLNYVDVDAKVNMKLFS